MALIVIVGGEPASAASKSSPAVKAPEKLAEKPADATVSQEVLVQREKRRLEELFIWKLSEELKLPVETEKAFAETIRSLNREKTRASLAVNEALTAIEKSQEGDRAISKAIVAKAVARYEKAWRAYGALPLREVSRMRAILGPERLGHYLVAKSQMTEKLKALAAREALESEAATPTPSAKVK